MGHDWVHLSLGFWCLWMTIICNDYVIMNPDARFLQTHDPFGSNILKWPATFYGKSDKIDPETSKGDGNLCKTVWGCLGLELQTNTDQHWSVVHLNPWTHGSFYVILVAPGRIELGLSLDSGAKSRIQSFPISQVVALGPHRPDRSWMIYPHPRLG